MGESVKAELRNFNWKVQTIIPSLIEGQDASVIYNLFRKDVTERFGGNQYLDVLNLVPAQGDSPAYVTGSNLFAAARIDTIARQNKIRVSTLSDLSNPQILSMVKDRFYSDTPALVAQSAEDSNLRNRSLLKQIIELAEQRQGSVKFPFMVTGFDVAPLPNDENGYGLLIEPRDDFAVTQEERLSGKYSNKTFNEVDEIGIPKFDKKGKRVFYSRSSGLSRLCLLRVLSLFADGGGLAASGGDGRVVLVSGEAADVDFVRQYQANLQAQIDSRKSELDKWFAKSMAAIPKGN